MKRKNIFNDIYRSKEYAEVDEPPKFPFIVDVELTNHCNLNCRMCSRQLMNRKKGYMSDEVFEKVLEECTKYKAPIRFIRWGEPLMHPKIIDFSCQVLDSGVPLHITTNGLLLTTEMMEYFLNFQLDSIIFSMQGAGKRGYEMMRGNHYNELTSKIDPINTGSAPLTTASSQTIANKSWAIVLWSLILSANSILVPTPSNPIFIKVPSGKLETSMARTPEKSSKGTINSPNLPSLLAQVCLAAS